MDVVLVVGYHKDERAIEPLIAALDEKHVAVVAGALRILYLAG